MNPPCPLCFSSSVSLAYQDGSRRAALGSYNFAGDLGKMIVPAMIALAAGYAGWQTGTLAYGLFGLAAAALIFVALGRLQVGWFEPSDAAAPFGWGIRDPRGFAVLSSIGVVDGAGRGAFVTFMPFLLLEKGAPIEGVGFALALLLGGGAAGKLICGLIA